MTATTRPEIGKVVATSTDAKPSYKLTGKETVRPGEGDEQQAAPEPVREGRRRSRLDAAGRAVAEKRHADDETNAEKRIETASILSSAFIRVIRVSALNPRPR